MSKSQPQTYPLEFSFEHNAKTYTEITVKRRPRVRDLIAAERQPGELGREAALLASISDFDFATIGEMDSDDFTSISAKAGAHFLSQRGDAGTSTGPSSSSTRGPTGDSQTS